MLLNMVMFKVTICDFGKMNINMTDKIEKKETSIENGRIYIFNNRKKVISTIH